jgi:type IX secretion system PorP/SprF family membrane protein
MKKIYLIIAAVAINFSLSAQQLSMYSQYYWNDFAINPAFTGFRNTPRIQIGYRNQWAGFQGAPKTYNIGGHTTLRNLNMGLGGMLFSDDQGGAIRQNGGMVNYSYQLKFGPLSHLSLGISGIINQYSFNGFNSAELEPDAVLQTNVKQVVPDLNFGLAYNFKNKLFLGLSANQIIQTKLKNFNTFNLTNKNQLVRHYYATASYLAKVSSKVDAEPYLLMRATGSKSPQLELGSKFTFNQMFIGGLSYRNKESAIAMLGVNYKQFLFVYSYDVLISEIRKYSGGSHELLLSYQFTMKDKPKKVEEVKVKDRDGDGILDNVDLCPNEKGLAYTNGCPDKDNDSIKDSEDACPDIAGLRTLNGCPDKDKDGIKDSEDTCPDVAGVAKFNGCPDTDNDGIKDSEDACPDIAGLPNLNGCPDSDNDGISDKNDECPKLSGPIENKGCPFGDSDNDGILDKDDACPSVAGLATFLGCPDSDNDGIKDSEDLCPKQKGLKAFGGCPDTDGDGLEDSKDNCPEIEGPIENKGCPAKKKRNIDDLMKKKLVCASGKPDITEQSKLVVKEIAEVLKEETTWTLTIEGHTDNVGDANANLLLSKKRSESVKNLLISYGIDASRINANYYGESKPIADNTTAEGRNKNRRIDFKFVMD